MKQHPENFLHHENDSRSGCSGMRRKRREKMLDASEIRLLMLHFLHHSAAHGYELIKLIEELSRGEYSPSPGLVYPNLTLLEEMAAIEVLDAQAARKAYVLTDAGRDMLASNEALVSGLIERLSTLAILVNNRSIPEVEQAIHLIRSTLNRRLAQENLSDKTLNTIISALNVASKKIAAS